MKPEALALAAAAALGACSSEREPTIEERFNATSAELENKAATIDSEAANAAAVQENILENELQALRRQEAEEGNSMFGDPAANAQ